MVKAGRNLWRSSCPSFLLSEGHSEALHLLYIITNPHPQAFPSLAWWVPALHLSSRFHGLLSTFITLSWILSSSSMSLGPRSPGLKPALKTWHQCWAYGKVHVSLPTLLLPQLRILLAFFTMRTCCWFMVNWLSTRTLVKIFSFYKYSIHFLPKSLACWTSIFCLLQVLDFQNGEALVGFVFIYAIDFPISWNKYHAWNQVSALNIWPFSSGICYFWSCISNSLLW